MPGKMEYLLEALVTDFQLIYLNILDSDFTVLIKKHTGQATRHTSWTARHTSQTTQHTSQATKHTSQTTQHTY